MNAGIGILAGVGVLFLVIVFLIVFVTRYYHRVPPSEVMVVYGASSGARFITNGGVFVKPIIETFKKLDLRIITVKTIKDEVYTISGVPIQLDWVSQVQIDSEDAALRTAAKAFLDKTPNEILDIIEETLSANFRAIVGQMSVEAIHRDRDDFVQRVQQLASDDVAAMGVKIISMGIEEITDGEGYLQAMAAPQIAAVKRDARIAEAEADREARVKAAAAKQAAEQAELDSQREILKQQEALSLREVEVKRQVGLAEADSNREVQERRALAIEQEQEANILVPARAQRQAIEVKAEAERQRITITADGEALATERTATAKAEATEKAGRAEAIALQARKEAEAQGIRANLLAEAEGRRKIAEASAAEGEINLRQFVIEQVTQADIEKVRAVSQAMAGLGNNVKIVQFGGQNGNSPTGNTLLDMIMSLPEVSQMFTTKVEALSGEEFEKTLLKATQLFNTLRSTSSPNMIDEDNDAGELPVNGQGEEKS